MYCRDARTDYKGYLAFLEAALLQKGNAMIDEVKFDPEKKTFTMELRGTGRKKAAVTISEADIDKTVNVPEFNALLDRLLAEVPYRDARLVEA